MQALRNKFFLILILIMFQGRCSGDTALSRCLDTCSKNTLLCYALFANSPQQEQIAGFAVCYFFYSPSCTENCTSRYKSSSTRSRTSSSSSSSSRSSSGGSSSSSSGGSGGHGGGGGSIELIKNQNFIQYLEKLKTENPELAKKIEAIPLPVEGEK